MMSKIRLPSRSAHAPIPTAVLASCVALVVFAGCASTSNGVRLESLGPSFPATIWESIAVVPSVEGVQRSFIPLAHLRVPTVEGHLDNKMIETLQREAARVGANAIVLADLSADDPWEERGSSAWAGVATAIRILDGRWADRYWSYGASPRPLEGPDVDALSPNRFPRPGERASEPTATGKTQDASSAAPRSVEPTVFSWRRVVGWSGKDIEETDSFTVPSGEWRITWQAVTGAARDLEIVVFEHGAEEPTARIKQEGVGTGSYLGLEGGGTYYLRIAGEGVSWEIAVDAWVQEP